MSGANLDTERLAVLLLNSNSTALFVPGSDNHGLASKLTGREAKALAAFLVARGVTVQGATAPEPGAQGLVGAYMKAYNDARAKLSYDAAHEIGLFAVYLHGKAAGRFLLAPSPTEPTGSTPETVLGVAQGDGESRPVPSVSARIDALTPEQCFAISQAWRNAFDNPGNGWAESAEAVRAALRAVLGDLPK